jgi:hypothetical protein
MSDKLLLIIFILISFESDAQKKWTGPATGKWEDAQNWQPRGVPVSTDDVVLDNSHQKNNYAVTMPDTIVNVHTLSLEPGSGNDIEVTIPASNKSNPALIVNDTGDSFNIKNGGVFRNSSGLSSGQSIRAGGLISIYTGGKYIHNSRSSHATEIVARLSVAPGTEKGIFEFDVPGGSYPISISNRIYGTLVLSSGASGGAQTYNASGASQVVMKGDFQINDGVQFNLDLTKDMVISDDYVQKGGVFNVASQPDNNTIKIKGSVTQSASATITGTSDGMPVIELCGEQKQLVSFAGNISNSVSLKINNPQGVALTSPMILPYKLQLMTGAIKTSRKNLLTLLDNGAASGGSVNSFVDGPVKKMGHDDFEFPVGKQGDYAPLKITGSGGSVADEFIAEYFLGNPAQVYGYSYERPPLVRISKLEYWILERLSGSSLKKIAVHVGNYSDATALENLELVRWDAAANIWKSEGNSFHSGIATGTLVSNEVSRFGAFTLGSTVEMQNPLPLDPDRDRRVAVPAKRSPLIIFRIVGGEHLQVQAVRDDMVTLIITDAVGRRVGVMKIRLSKGFNNIRLELNAFAKGVYFFSLYDSAGRFLGVEKGVSL